MRASGGQYGLAVKPGSNRFGRIRSVDFSQAVQEAGQDASHPGMFWYQAKDSFRVRPRLHSGSLSWPLRQGRVDSRSRRRQLVMCA